MIPRRQGLGLGIGAYAVAYVVAIGAYVLGLIATMPATWIDAGLARASGGALRLAEARGTIWAGEGEFEARDPNGTTGVAQHLTWRFAPGPLLRGRIGFDVQLGRGGRRFPVSLGPTGMEITDADVRLPAAMLGLAVPKLGPLRLTGDLLLHCSHLSIASGTVQGEATLQWLSAGSAASPVSPLGDYELRLDGKGTIAQASLRTLQGPLQLDGRGSWAIGANPAFLATARVAPAYREQLAPLLQLIAVERGDGSFELQLK